MDKTTGPRIIHVEVAYAEPDSQEIVALELPAESTVGDAIRASFLSRRYPRMNPERDGVGIWNKVKTLDDKLREGDRVEIYRPLKADPKEVRRHLAAQGKVMGRRLTALMR